MLAWSIFDESLSMSMGKDCACWMSAMDLVSEGTGDCAAETLATSGLM